MSLQNLNHQAEGDCRMWRQVFYFKKRSTKQASSLHFDLKSFNLSSSQLVVINVSSDRHEISSIVLELKEVQL